jgi:hypothetical protein
MIRLIYPQYVAFVRRKVSPGQLQDALHAFTVELDYRWPNILVSYYSLPDYLNTFDVDTTMNWSIILHNYWREMQQHHDGVKAAFDIIADPKWGTGQALLNEIKASNPRRVRIMPHDHVVKEFGFGDSFDATTSALSANDDLSVITGTIGGPHNDTTFQMREISDSAFFDSFARGTRIRGEKSRGTGIGADGLIAFSPEVFDPNNPSRPNIPGWDADEILYHELVHASRVLRGAELDTRVIASWSGQSNNDSWANEKEYLAIIITDMYMSEKGKTSLRVRHDLPPGHLVGRGSKAHFVDTPVNANYFVMQDPDTFYEKNPDHMNISPKQLMRDFRSGKQRPFFDALARLPVGRPRFNPPQRFDQDVKAGRVPP